MEGLEGESDVDEEFRLGVGEAAGRYAVKRRKKHMFNDAGVPIEPFNLENDIKEGYLTNEGVFKLAREKRQAEEDSEEDAWYESVKDDQAKMLREKALREQDSDRSESADEDGGVDQSKEGVDNSEAEEGIDRKERENEIRELKREMLGLMQEQENAN